MKPAMKGHRRLSVARVRAIAALLLFLFVLALTTLYCVIDHNTATIFALDNRRPGQSGGEGAAPSALTLLTFASHKADFLCRMVSSAVMNGIAVKVIGFDHDRTDVLFRKIPVTLAELKKRDPDEVVLFVDAFDVVITATSADIVSEFRALRSDLVFAGERGCWPFMDGRADGDRICQERYPPSPTPYRYLNSGAWIGYVHAAVDAFEAMMELPETQERAIDQELASILYLERGGRITLDQHARIMQCVHLSADDLEFRRRSGRTVVYNRRTQTYPSILHFNGNGKDVQEAFHQRLGLRGQHAMRSAFRDLVQPVQYDAVCPDSQ